MSLALNKFHLNKSYSSFTQSICMILKDQNLSGFKQTYQVNFTTVESALPICALDNIHLTFCCRQKNTYHDGSLVSQCYDPHRDLTVV